MKRHLRPSLKGQGDNIPILRRPWPCGHTFCLLTPPRWTLSFWQELLTLLRSSQVGEPHVCRSIPANASLNIFARSQQRAAVQINKHFLTAQGQPWRRHTARKRSSRRREIEDNRKSEVATHPASLAIAMTWQATFCCLLCVLSFEKPLRENESCEMLRNQSKCNCTRGINEDLCKSCELFRFRSLFPCSSTSILPYMVFWHCILFT